MQGIKNMAVRLLMARVAAFAVPLVLSPTARADPGMGSGEIGHPCTDADPQVGYDSNGGVVVPLPGKMGNRSSASSRNHRGPAA